MKNLTVLTLAALLVSLSGTRADEPMDSFRQAEQARLEVTSRMDQNLRSLSRLVDELQRQGARDQQQIRTLQLEIEKLRLQAEVAKERGQKELTRVQESYVSLDRKYQDLASDNARRPIPMPNPPAITPARRSVWVPVYCCPQLHRVVGWVQSIE